MAKVEKLPNPIAVLVDCPGLPFQDLYEDIIEYTKPTIPTTTKPASNHDAGFD